MSSSSPRKQVRSGRTSSSRIPMRKGDNSKNNSNNNNAVLEETPKQSRIPRRSDQSTDSGNVQPSATVKNTSTSKIRKLETPKSSKLRAPSQSFVTSTPKSSQGTKDITITTNTSVTTSVTASSRIPKLRSSGPSGTSVSGSKVNSSINNGKHRGSGGRANGNVSGTDGVKRGPSQSPELALPVQTIAASWSDSEDGAMSPLPSDNAGEFSEVDLQTVGSVPPDPCIRVTESIAVSFDESFMDANGDTRHDVGVFAVTTGKLVTQSVFGGAVEPMSPILHSEPHLQEPTGESGFYESLEQASDLQGSLSVGLQDRSEYDEGVWASDDEHDHHSWDGGEKAEGLISAVDRALPISETGFPETTAMVCDVVEDEVHDVFQNGRHDSVKPALQDLAELQEAVPNVQQIHDDTESDDDTIKVDDQEAGLNPVIESSPILIGQSTADTEVDTANTEVANRTVDVILLQQAVHRSVEKGNEQEVEAQASMDTMITGGSDNSDEDLVELPCHESDNLLLDKPDDGPMVQQTLEVHAMPVTNVSISETVAVDFQNKVVTMDTTYNEDDVSKHFTEPQEEVLIVQQTSDSSEDAAVSESCDLIHQENVASVVTNSLCHISDVGDQETTKTVEVLTATSDVLETRRAESMEPCLQELVEPRYTGRSVSHTVNLHELEPVEPNGTHSKPEPELDGQDTTLAYDLEDTVLSTCTPEISKKDYELGQSLTSAELAFNYSEDAVTSAVILPESATSGAILPESATSGAILPESATSGVILPEVATSGTILPEVATSGAILPEVATSGAILPESAKFESQEEEDDLSLAIHTSGTNDADELHESPENSQIVSHASVNGTDISVKLLEPEPLSLTDPLPSTKTHEAEPIKDTVKLGHELESEQTSSFTNPETTSGSDADENSNESSDSPSAFQIAPNSMIPEEEKEVKVAKINNKVDSSKDDTDSTKNVLPSTMSSVQAEEPLTSFSILQSFAKNGIAAKRENNAFAVESIKDSVDSGPGIKSFTRTSDQHSVHLENLIKPRSGTPDSCSETGSQHNGAVKASTGIATDDKKEANIQRLESGYVTRQTPVWQQSTVTSTSSPVYGTVLKTTTTLSAKTEKILASSNMLKACIGQASLPKRFRSLSGMMTTASDASSSTSRNDSGYEDSASQPTPPEDVYDLETLEKMLEAANNYDQRRRIRAQMRIVKKNQGPGEEKKSSLMVIDLKNGNNSVNQSHNGHLGRNGVASLSVMSTTATRSVNYSYENLIGNGVTKTTEQVWQNIDCMVADSLNTNFDNGSGTDTIPPLLPPSHPRSSLLDDFDSRPTNKMGDTMWVQGVNLLEVNDELKLHELLDRSEDYEDRKIIRARLKDVIAENRVKREEFIRRREEEREEFLRARVRDADEQKRRTLAMYDAMAKSAPAGGNKTLDVSILRGEGSGRSTPTLTNSPGAKVDLVEQAIRQRQKEADDRKKKVLAAYDQAARSGPAGSARFVDFDAVRDQDAKGTKPLSPRERFQKMDSDVAPKGTNAPVAKPANAGLVRSPTAIKEMLLNWVKSKTKEYDSVPIENFSTSWNDGMAFCALIHHFYPDAFDFSTLNPKNRRANFELAFRVAEEKADISPLLDVEDMVIMKKPDWKCVFTYVQSIYRRLHNAE